jgi:hypothetical protein
MWTEEKRKAASDKAKARWANPEYKKKQGDSVKKPPCCPKCGETDIAKFYVDEKGRRTNSTCRECHKIGCKERWHKRTETDRQASRAYKYGITPNKFLEMLAEQNGKCKICGTKPTTQRGLHVDHCHTTGIVRGLLCHGCNVALGNMKEDPEILLKAVEYLRSNHGSPKYC